MRRGRKKEPHELWLKKFYDKVEYEVIIQEGRQWTDDKFPPEYSSICGNSYDNKTRKPYDWIEWKRASEIFPDGYQIFPNKIEPD